LTLSLDIHFFSRFARNRQAISGDQALYASRFLADADSEWVVSVLPVAEGGDLGWESVVLDVNVYLTV
jgi:hypothetical protein